MRLVKIGMSNINTTVGAFRSNVDKIKEAAVEMDKMNCDIGCFQEMVISGYPAEDLLLWEHYIKNQHDYLNELAVFTKDINLPLIVGLAYQYNSLVYNVAALIGYGDILGIIPKEKLPNYDVFYDERQFAAGLANYVDIDKKFGDIVFVFSWGKTSVCVCEDMWSVNGPISRKAFSGAELIFNISASPWRYGIVDIRKNIIRTRSEDNQIALVYVNQFGGDDSLIFDGGSIIAQSGDIMYESYRWEEAVNSFVIDLDQVSKNRKQNTTWRNDYNIFMQQNKPSYILEIPHKSCKKIYHDINIEKKETYHYFIPHIFSKEPDITEEIINAILTGLNDYYYKTKTFKGIGIALSGGRDSVLTTILAAEWAKRINEDPKMIKCYSMPSQFNSDTTKSIASDIALILNTDFIEINIQDTFQKEVNIIKETTDNQELKDITFQNIQARIRGMRMWNLSNELDLLWLQSSNMSEKAVGYSTIGGDMMGGYSLLGGMPKTLVNKVLSNIKDGNYLKICNPSLSLTLEILLNTKASAELSENQQDERDLMPFEILDLCYLLFVKEKKTPQEIYDYLNNKFSDKELLKLAPNYKTGMLKLWVISFIKMFFRSIYKWTQSVHLGSIDLDRERALQIPVVNSLEWLNLDILGNR